ncbi:hypothetical protein EN962_26125 [Mesorhizobium sp. M7A.F.Ca.CA.001.09.2.1]|uniref:Transcriptional regulator n=1 Tax=Mesorhizobium ciceri TaxID=39645 RepID=A0AB38T5Q1_9HYPH|nr:MULTISPECIES: hypothetical protein [Mesorhizobium]RUY31593.1 hypothetical protein EN981_31255 [Mesorhizobium sp. M7A.F.Ca.CA.001.13.2.1]MDF3217489.1 hypothetical protein [Mesorhizobium ciceri]RUY66299.1 hypothetical protein EN980_20325 [Mesorhizobium sp. M7A.F.Ca.CA.001.13.1.1]RUY69710.1 hypothetical protein EN965_11280 [Mesorhizobium sp. M7A.F.Ca.CA.001.05.1.1]RUY74595.1 hypothetical protein EN962_26125 [Mesorhizobium sp. M7A.F.Ca.CA.001.09.2.1]
MSFDPASLTYGFVGLAAGAGVHFFRRKTELEHQCEFLADVREDLLESFSSAGTVLDDKNTPKPIRQAILVLLAAYGDKKRGKSFAETFLVQVNGQEDAPSAEDDGMDPISQSMKNLGRANPALARQTHHVMASLVFGLVFLNLADDFKVEKMKTEAARDPVSLWARIARLFASNGGPDHHAGGKLIAA